MADDGGKKKKSRKDRAAEERAFNRSLGFNTGIAGFKPDLIADRHMDDQRYERELAFKAQQAAGKAAALAAVEGKARVGSGQRSATFDTLIRMEAGLEGRTIADKINDKNRPTWDEYKKKNEEALDMEGSQLKKMAAYRAELDAEREAMLAKARGAGKKKADAAISDSDDDGDNSSDSDSDSDGKRKKKKHKKEKKHKKHKKDKKKDKKEKKAKKSAKDGPGEEEDRGFRYSDFFNKASDSDSD